MNILITLAIIVAVIAALFLVLSSDAYKNWLNQRAIRKEVIVDPKNPYIEGIFGTLNKLLQIAEQKEKLTKSDIESVIGPNLKEVGNKERVVYEAPYPYPFEAIRYDESFGLVELKINPKDLIPFYEVENRFGSNYKDSPYFPDSDTFSRSYYFTHYRLSFEIVEEAKFVAGISIDFGAGRIPRFKN